MFFGVDGMNVFHKVHNGVIPQMQNKYSPHLEGIHYMAHHTNLVVQKNLNIYCEIY
jgi:hypothetical protein